MTTAESRSNGFCWPSTCTSKSCLFLIRTPGVSHNYIHCLYCVHVYMYICTHSIEHKEKLSLHNKVMNSQKHPPKQDKIHDTVCTNTHTRPTLVCMHACLWVHVYVFVSMYVYTYICSYLPTRTCTIVCVRLCVPALFVGHIQKKKKDKPQLIPGI